MAAIGISYIFSENERTQLTSTCSKSTIETLEKGVKYVDFEHHSGVFIVNFQRILHLVLVFLFLTLNK